MTKKTPQTTLLLVPCTLSLDPPSHIATWSLLNSLCILVQSIQQTHQPFPVQLAPKERLDEIITTDSSFLRALRRGVL